MGFRPFDTAAPGASGAPSVIEAPPAAPKGRFRAFEPQAPAVPQVEPTYQPTLKETLLAPLETAAALVTGAGAPVAGAIESLVTGRDYDQARESWAYAPQNPRAQANLQALGQLPGVRQVGELLHAGGQKISDLTGGAISPTAGADALGLALPAAGKFGAPLAKGAARVTGSADRAAGAAAVAGNAQVQMARKLGLKLRPEDVQARIPGQRTPGRTASRLVSPTDIKTDFTLHNQGIITREAGAELGLSNATELTEATFNKLKAPEHAIYEQAERAATRVPISLELQGALQDGIKLAKFKAGDRVGVTRTLSALRRNGNKHAQAADVATQEAGYAELAAADRLEAAFGAQLEAVGEANMLSQFQAARQRLAKIHNVEGATRAGHVDVADLYKMAERGAPLTGRLKMLAEIGEAFPNITRHSLKTAAGAPVGGEITKYGVIRSGINAAARNVPGLRSRLNPYSEGFQNRIGPAATDVERSYFGSYGQPLAPLARLGAPGKSLDVIEPDAALSRALGVEGRRPLPRGPEPSLSAETPPVGGYPRLPEAPSRLTAETPPAVAGDINFRAAQPNAYADSLAGDLGLAPSPSRAQPMPALADQLAGDLQLERPMARPPQRELPVTTEQPPPALELSRDQKPRANINMDDEALIPDSTVLKVNDGKREVGFIAFKENADGQLQISRTKVVDDLRGKKGPNDPRPGQELILKAVDHAESVGKPLVSDKTVTVAQLRAYESLVKKGKLSVEYTDPKAVAAALKRGDNRAVVKGPGGQPVIKVIVRKKPALGEALAPPAGP